MTMMLVGLSGDSRSGKDSVADILVAEHGFVKRSLADPIREILLRVNPILSIHNGWRTLSTSLQAVYTFNQGDWNKIKAECPEVVDMMINLGHGIREEIHPDAFIWGVLNDWPSPTPRIVIPDIRQPNEVDMIIKNGGRLWKIHREGTTPRAMDRLIEDTSWDAHIYNNRTIDDLRDIVRKLKFLRDMA